MKTFPFKRLGWNFCSPFLTTFVILLLSCNSSDKIEGTGGSGTGNSISLTGRVIGNDNSPISGVIVALSRTGVMDTTDAQGRYRIYQSSLAKKTLAKTLADSVLDTLVFKQNGQEIATLDVTNWVDTLPDFKVVQRDISGNLLSGSVQIAKIKVALFGDGIPQGQPLMANFFYNALSSNYSGFLYFHVADSVQNYAVYVGVYDSLGHLVGRSQTVPFTSEAGDITVPPFNPGNAIPKAFAGNDTILHVNDTIALRGMAVDSFGGTILKWEWDIGGTGVFRVTSSGDTVIQIPSKPAGDYLCVLRVMDNDSNMSPNDTLVVNILSDAPLAPRVSVPASITNNAKPTWTWVSEGGAGNGTYHYKMDNPDLSSGATITTDSSFTPTSSLSEGLHTLYLQERSNAGNWSSTGNASLTVDLTPPLSPSVSVISPTNNPLPTWTWTSGEGGNGTYKYRLDNPDLSAGVTTTTSTTYTPTLNLADGSHTLCVQGRDSAGNWSTSGCASANVVPNAPVVTLSTPGLSTTNQRPSWTWVDGGRGNGTFRLKLDDPNLNMGSTQTTSFVFTPDSDLAYGSHSLYVQESDSVGNWSTTGSASVSIFNPDSSQTLVAVGGKGAIFRTTNGGVTWTTQTSGTTNGLEGLYFVDPNTGWAVGASGTILKTTDGGVTWMTQTSETTYQLERVYFVDMNTGWAVGNGNAILKTTDGGITWMVQNGKGSFYAIDFVDANTGWVAGTNGTILKTTDGGVTWMAQNSGTTQELWYVYFVNANTGWATGASGTILKTIDGGVTWTTQISGTTQSLQGLYFADVNTGWAAAGGAGSNSGAILTTTNGGATWVTQMSTTLGLWYVYFANANLGWVAGGGTANDIGSILKTTDGGATWTAQSSGLSFLRATLVP